MIAIYYKKKFVTIGQVWYLKDWKEWFEKGNDRADLVFFHGMEKTEVIEESVKKHAVFSDFHSLYTDLNQSEEELLQQINKAERYQIRKSERDEVTVRFFSKEELQGNETVVGQLARMYEALYREKGNPQTFNHTQFREYLKEQCVTVSCAYQGENPLVFHSYIVDEKQARLLHSVSEFRNPDLEANVIGRANKKLHYEDLCYFKKEGLSRYDWGGISSLENPNGIDTFKMKFGGTPVTYQNIIYGNTLLGKIAIIVMKVTGKK